MAAPSYSGGWSGRGRRFEQGQALVYGLFVLVGGLAALFFLFNTGQLTREKTKLVNTADAVAYSAGVMNARALNFQAYTNRAMVANTVAIAQLVSLSSWIQYTSNVANHSYPLENPKFVQFYPSYFAAQAAGDYLQYSLNEAGILEGLATASDTIVSALEGAQRLAYVGLVPARQEVMQQVAEANYANDGSVVVEQLSLRTSDYTSFVAHYTGDDRTRFAEVARVSANKDSFVPKRSWKMSALYPDCLSAFPRVDWLDRRGGTELIGFDQWQALDTLSEKNWVRRNLFDFSCSGVAETAAGSGGTIAADEQSANGDPTRYDQAPLVNGESSAAGLAGSASWGYSGLPGFYDLSDEMRALDDPRLQFAVRIRRDKTQTLTSEGRSAVRPTARLNAYTAQPAGGSDLVAVSTSEVFFQRSQDAEDNSYGRSLGKAAEIGSLFNPYWQVHLIQSDADIKRAQALQGVLVP